MHSFDRYLRRRASGARVHHVCAQGQKVGTTPGASASEPGGACRPRSRPPAARTTCLLEQELRVSKSSASTADDFRVVINRYWSFVRRYPTSGFADNALWQAANLSADAFRAVQPGPRQISRGSALSMAARSVSAQPPSGEEPRRSIEQLETMARRRAACSAGVASRAAASSPPSDSTIRAVQREVLPDVVRVTVELDREVPFYQERIEGPARLFFDLKGTKTVPSLVDATFRYDSDIVRHIRLGRHPNNTTRVVLDLENVGALQRVHSVQPVSHRDRRRAFRRGSPMRSLQHDRSSTPIPRHSRAQAA